MNIKCWRPKRDPKVPAVQQFIIFQILQGFPALAQCIFSKLREDSFYNIQPEFPLPRPRGVAFQVKADLEFDLN